MKICIVTGGTGGHIFPAITYADFAKKKSNYDIFFIGNKDRMESKLVPEAGYPFLAINNKGLQGSRSDKIKAIFGQFSAIKQAKKHLKSERPDLVFSFGGYVSVPVVLAARSLKIPVVVHEQNAIVGKANKLASHFAKAVITSYPQTMENGSKVHFLGNPRSSLAENEIISKKEFHRIGLNPELETVLIVMGSQGSTAMNPIFKEFLNSFNSNSYQVVLTTGDKHIEDFRKSFTELPSNVHLEGFVDQKSLLPFCDLIVARAGASTVAEIQSYGVASMLIPSPHVANNHQYYNALALADAEASILIEEKGLTGKQLYKNIDELMKNKRVRLSLKENAARMSTPQATRNIHSLIEKVITDEQKKNKS